MHKYLVSLAFVLSVLSFSVVAQPDRKFEVGGFVSSLKLTDSNGESPVGIGGRFGYNFSKYVSADAEIAHFPENGQGAFGQTVVLAGVKAGYRGRRAGIFAKIRPGIAHFGGSRYSVFDNDQPTKFALDLGGVAEYYPSSRTIVRLDVGKTMIDFGNDRFPSGTAGFTYQPGRSLNWQTSIGFGYRF